MLRNLQEEYAHYQTTKAAVTVSKEAAVATLRDELEQLRAAKEQLSSAEGTTDHSTNHFGLHK